jgi:hypothetical protein
LSSFLIQPDSLARIGQPGHRLDELVGVLDDPDAGDRPTGVGVLCLALRDAADGESPGAPLVSPEGPATLN